MRADATVVFDDYYVDPGPELEGLGCQTIIAGLDRGMYTVELLEPSDAFAKPWGVLKVRMVRVRRAAPTGTARPRRPLDGRVGPG